MEIEGFSAVFTEWDCAKPATDTGTETTLPLTDRPPLPAAPGSTGGDSWWLITFSTTENKNNYYYSSRLELLYICLDEANNHTLTLF